MAAQFTKNIGAGVGRISNVIFSKAEGNFLIATNGERYLDFTSGIGVTSTGHCHPKVVKAAQEQTANLIHCQVSVGYSTATLDLVKTLLPVMPKGLDSFVFLNSGSEAVENAVKLARQATNKPNVIVFKGGYHGRTLGAMSMTTSKTIYRSKFGPHLPGIFVTPFPYCLHCPASCGGKSVSDACCNNPLNDLKELLKTQTSPDETCAVIVEPVLGEGGYVPLPPGFLKGVRKICDENKMLLITDEVQTGFGRTGKLFASDGHYDTIPDIMVIAKGLASGFPIAGIVSRTELTATQPAGSMGGTYTCNPVACAAATATQQVIQEERLVENSAARGAQLKAGLQKLAASGKYPIRDVRGLGLMVAMEFNKDVPYGTANAVSKACLDNKMLLLTTSIFETVRFIPCLTVSAAEIDQGLAVFEQALNKVFVK